MGDSEGQGSLVCCREHGVTKSRIQGTLWVHGAPTVGSVGLNQPNSLKIKVKTFSSGFHFLPKHPCDSVTSGTVAHQAPLSMENLQARILEWVAMPSSKAPGAPLVKNPPAMQENLV